MVHSKLISGACALLSLFSLGACGTVMTRPFAPVSQPPEAASQPEFATAFQACVKQVTGSDATVYDGRKTSTGLTGGRAIGGAVASSAVLGGVGAYSAGLGMYVVGIPAAVGYGAVRGVRDLGRDGVEGQIKREVAQCMAASNWRIVSWTKIKKGQTAGMVTPVDKPGNLRPSRK